MKGGGGAGTGRGGHRRVERQRLESTARDGWGGGGGLEEDRLGRGGRAAGLNTILYIIK
jgi:hypothetical protein